METYEALYGSLYGSTFSTTHNFIEEYPCVEEKSKTFLSFYVQEFQAGSQNLKQIHEELHTRLT